MAASFVQRLTSTDSESLPLRKPKFTPNGRPMNKDAKKNIRPRPHTTIPLYMMEKPKRVVYMSLHDCMMSRPPMRCDLAGPTPCTYSPRKTGSNTSCVISPKSNKTVEHTVTSSVDLWTQRTQVADKMPTPATYYLDNVFGLYQPIRKEAPAFSFGVKRHSPKKGWGVVPAPNTYNLNSSERAVFRTAPSFTIGSRSHGQQTLTPGPAQYHPNYSVFHNTAPQFSMQARRRIITGLKC